MTILYLLIFMAGIIGLLLIFTRSFRTQISMITVVALLVVGQLQYFLNINSAHWLTYILGLVLFAKLLMFVSVAKSSEFGIVGKGNYVLLAVFLLFVVVLISSIINMTPLLHVVLSIKHYCFLWSVSLVFLFGAVDADFFNNFWEKLLWIAPIQLPIILYQRFIVSNARSTSAEWDSIVGLFGGNPNGGGASGAMALFLIFLILLSITYWHENKISLAFMILTVCCSLLSIGLAEVKIAVFLLPVGVSILHKKHFIKHPFRSLNILGFVVGVSLFILYGYQFQFSYGGGGPSSMPLYDFVLMLFTGTAMEIDFVNNSREMGRVAALYLWWEAINFNEFLQFLFGYGVGAVRESGVFVGEIASRYYFIVARSTMAIYLWEVGIVGFSLLVSLLIAASIMASRLFVHAIKIKSASGLEAISAFLVIVVLALPYNTDMAYIPSFQLMISLMIGNVFAVRRSLFL